MPEVVFAIPGDLSSPTGGYHYDRRILALLPSFGVDARHAELPGAFPDPAAADLAETERLLAQTPEDATLLIDGLAYGALPTNLVRRLERPIVALVHHPLCHETGLSAERQAELFASEKAALELARHVIVTSAATARILATDFAVPENKITVAEPGTDPALRATGTGTPLQLLAVGTVQPRKGYDVLLRALKPLAHLDWRLTIAGATDRDPEAVAALKAEIAASGLEERITLAGTVVPATLDRFYQSADLFVMPSLFEGYGMALTEAMIRGLPIVCTTSCVAVDTVPEGAAIKVPPGDAQALEKALAMALSDRKLRVRLADAAWEAGRKLPTWNETTRRIAAVLLGLEA